MPNPSLVRRHKGIVRHSLDQMLHIDVVRYGVAWVRFTWYVRVRRRLRTLEGAEGVAASTVRHNLGGLSDLAVARALYLIRPLSVLEQLRPDADVLAIGPRTEGELLALFAHGFDRTHVRAVDLIAYSPWVDLGDMHALPYSDDSFDAVVAGWVLAYSDDKHRAAAEMARVVRPGGFIAIGVEWSPRSNEDIVADFGYLPGSEDRLTSTEAILDLFSGVDREVVARQDLPSGRSDVRSLVVVFRVD